MTLELSLDRHSPIPLYFQLSQGIERAIRDGLVKPGEHIEAEVDLAARLGLSRPTVRQAIADLVNKGLVVRRRGVGTQVVHSKLRRSLELTSLYDDLTNAKHVPTTSVLEFSVKKADKRIAELLAVGSEDRVLHLKRLRRMDDDPLAIMRNWIPESVLDTTREELEATGLYELLRRKGVHVKVANQRIGAAVATAAEAKLLAVKAGAPLLVMERTAFDDTGRVIETSSHKYRADLYSFETTLVAH